MSWRPSGAPRTPLGRRSAAADPSEAGGRSAPAMVDGFGRRIEYLRISVTDKCNLRCVYCMPEEGLHWLRRDELLSYEEIARVVETMAGMGLRRLRLTGGEPLVRKDLDRLASLLRAVDGIEDIALSTNAVLLAPVARRLRDAGISRINISLDSLRPERADEIARRPGTLARVMEGLDAALDALREMAPKQARYALGAHPGAGKLVRDWNVILPRVVVEPYREEFPCSRRWPGKAG